MANANIAAEVLLTASGQMQIAVFFAAVTRSFLIFKMMFSIVLCKRSRVYRLDFISSNIMLYPFDLFEAKILFSIPSLTPSMLCISSGVFNDMIPHAIVPNLSSISSFISFNT